MIILFGCFFRKAILKSGMRLLAGSFATKHQLSQLLHQKEHSIEYVITKKRRKLTFLMLDVEYDIIIHCFFSSTFCALFT